MSFDMFQICIYWRYNNLCLVLCGVRVSICSESKVQRLRSYAAWKLENRSLNAKNKHKFKNKKTDDCYKQINECLKQS